MKIENVNLNLLKPLEKNVRKHSDKQIEELIRSVEQFGQTRAVVIDEDNNILIGNGLYLALVKMGYTDCQCYRITGLTEIQKKKLVLTDNKVYSLGSDNYQAINDYIQDITVTGDFDIAGFDDFILKNMTMSDEENEEAMKDYGTITDIKFTEPQQEPVINPSVRENNNSNINTDTNTSTSSSSNSELERVATIVTEKPAQEQKQDRKYVICPNCGEVIYLD